jgi:Bacteriophage protein of unknown function (DUF646).
MVFISINITGLDEIISNLERMRSESPNIIHDILQHGSDFMANQMRANAHVVTGRMKGSINNHVAGNEGVVEVPVPYAQIENKRVGSKPGFGPHDFADRALSATAQILPSIIMSALQRWTSL